MGDFKLLRRTDESRTVHLLTADGPLWGSVNRGQSAFGGADSPPVSDSSDLVLFAMFQCGLILVPELLFLMVHF